MNVPRLDSLATCARAARGSSIARAAFTRISRGSCTSRPVNRRPFLFATLSAAAILLAAGAHALFAKTAPRPTPTPRAETVAGVSIALAARMNDGLYRGAQPDAAGLAELRALGVRTVLDLRESHDETADVVAAGFRSAHVPVVGGREAAAPTDAQVRAFFDVVLDPTNRPVFVHCSHGKDRTGALCAAYRMEIDGWTPEQALDEMRALGFNDDHPKLTEFVLSYRLRGFAARR